MTVLTLRLPDDTGQRLKRLAGVRGMSVNKLLEELSTAALAANDAEVRFRLTASSADRAAAVAVLDRLDRYSARGD